MVIQGGNGYQQYRLVMDGYLQYRVVMDGNTG
jgi:hypothetical protein